jgi:4-hydroxy-tetrahydrodipicolinate synthase
LTGQSPPAWWANGVGEALLRRVIAAYPEARRQAPALRMVVVAGPRSDPAPLPRHDGLEVHAFVDRLYRHLAARDLAVVQGGLTTTVELTANRRPFLYFPLGHHFDQSLHVRHRLGRYRAGRRMDFAISPPDAIAAAVVEELGREVDHRPVETGGAATAARLLELLQHGAPAGAHRRNPAQARRPPRFGPDARVESSWLPAGGAPAVAPAADLRRTAMPGRFGRVLTAMATPFDRDGNLDVAGAQHLARHLLDHGTDTLVVAGTTGESPTLTADEKARLWAAVVEAAGDGARVMAGTSTYSTAESLELTRLAEKAGAGSLLLVTPYYNKPPQAGLVAHFSAIAAATPLPCMLYNIPSRTACTIEVPTMVRLFEAHDNIVAVKEAVGDLAAASRLHRDTGGSMEQYSGDDKNLLPLLAVGGVGVVSVASHLVGPALQDLVAAFERGDTRTALDLHMRHIALFEGLFATSSPILLKACMNLLGLPAGPLRPPLVDATPEQVDFARGLLAGVGLTEAPSSG